MNLKQRLVLYVCAISIILMLLFPPYYYRYYRPGEYGADVIRDLGYSFILQTPKVHPFESPGLTIMINIEMLLVQWAAVLIVGGLLWFAMKSDTQN